MMTMISSHVCSCHSVVSLRCIIHCPMLPLCCCSLGWISAAVSVLSLLFLAVHFLFPFLSAFSFSSYFSCHHDQYPLSSRRQESRFNFGSGLVKNIQITVQVAATDRLRQNIDSVCAHGFLMLFFFGFVVKYKNL